MRIVKCPFCKSEKDLVMPIEGELFVSCAGCDASGPIAYGEFDSLEEGIERAIHLWNQWVTEDGRMVYTPPIKVMWWEVPNPDYIVCDSYEDFIKATGEDDGSE